MHPEKLPRWLLGAYHHLKKIKIETVNCLKCMNTKLLATVIVLASSSLAVSVKAQQPKTQVPTKLSSQVLNACVQKLGLCS
ncbi:hypothetical protein [Fischerella thermalis]|uniref:hypothetical protein n=1 Tax=Fischerella thermalis TaxID=372787 RepID=UPI000C80DE85|nr:hypothetical protein [Fischerella thermalis]MBF1989776.1 hypothetical protein [Fischerella thermalis M58_A2018_009]MBF2068727.1 hypothetical protein [Fischerella thermalis M48_A2018_028]PLZ87838.1 hypothetical protein CI593_15610 [Fischerella thermalis CCMEE 5194]